MPLPSATLFALSAIAQSVMIIVVAVVLRQRGRIGVVSITVVAAFCGVLLPQAAVIAALVFSPRTLIASDWETPLLLALGLALQVVASAWAWREREPVSLAFVGAILTALIMLPIVILFAAFGPNGFWSAIVGLALLAGTLFVWHFLTWALILHWARRIPTPVGICHRCGYELGELRRSICPECGELVN